MRQCMTVVEVVVVVIADISLLTWMPFLRRAQEHSPFLRADTHTACAPRLRNEEANTENEMRQRDDAVVNSNKPNCNPDVMIGSVDCTYSKAAIGRLREQLMQVSQYKATPVSTEAFAVSRTSQNSDPRSVCRDPSDRIWRCSCLEDKAWGIPC